MFKWIFGVVLTALIAVSLGRRPSVDRLPIAEPTDDEGLLNTQEDLNRNISTTTAQPPTSEKHIYEITDNSYLGNQEDPSTTSEKPASSQEKISITTDSSDPGNQEDPSTTSEKPVSSQEKISNTTDSADPGNQEDPSTTSEKPASSQEKISITTDSADPGNQKYLVRESNTSTEHSLYNEKEISSTTDTVQLDNLGDTQGLYEVKNIVETLRNLEKNSLIQTQTKFLEEISSLTGHAFDGQTLVNEIATDMSDKVLVYEVDVDGQADVASQYNVYAMPTFVFIRNNIKLEQFPGANEPKLMRTLQKYI